MDMEMQVNSQLIKSEREQRAWSQEHLARVAGLGHRTVQRIESTGIASFESVMALACALEVNTADLNAESSNSSSNPAVAAPSIKLELPVRLLLAIASGILVPLLIAMYPPGSGSSDTGGMMYAEVLRNLFCGALFGATVLCPYLPRDGRLFRRSIGLTLASAVSFQSAYMAAIQLLGFSELLAFLVASSVGVAILVFAVRFVVPLKLKNSIWLPIIGASLIGGTAIFIGLWKLSDFEFATITTISGFCVWHCLLSLVFYFGRPVDEAGNRPGSILLDFLVWTARKFKALDAQMGAVKLPYKQILFE